MTQTPTRTPTPSATPTSTPTSTATGSTPAPAPGGGLLAGKRILVTGVVSEASLAFHVARLAQQEQLQPVRARGPLVLAQAERVGLQRGRERHRPARRHVTDLDHEVGPGGRGRVVELLAGRTVGTTVVTI